MKRKRKSPKAIRQERWGYIITMGQPFTVSGSLNFGSSLQADSAVAFTFDYDTGIQRGDSICVTGATDAQKVDHRKVHVARRRQSINKYKPIIFEVESVSATTMTVKATDGGNAANGVYTVTSI